MCVVSVAFNLLPPWWQSYKHANEVAAQPEAAAAIAAMQAGVPRPRVAATQAAPPAVAVLEQIISFRRHLWSQSKAATVGIKITSQHFMSAPGCVRSAECPPC